MRVVLSRLVHFRWFFWRCVVLLTIATSIFYFVVRGWFLNQSATYTSVISDITVNFILLFFLIGVSVDVIGKQRKWSRTKGNVVLVVVLMVVILLFRLLGFRTRFG
jgi:ABC-type transport system involved in cytochrome bd biosynthesis fused ATPase/permease subunit